MHTLKPDDHRPWPRDPRFTVYADGRIVGPSGRVRKPSIQRGRAAITVYADGQWQREAVAVIVCETFHGPRPDPKMHAAHSNGVALDNRAENLSWRTARDNEGDKIKHGTALVGERHHQAKLTADDVRAIRSKRLEGRLLWDLAAVYGVTETTISHICRYRTWRHI